MSNKVVVMVATKNSNGNVDNIGAESRGARQVVEGNIFGQPKYLEVT